MFHGNEANRKFKLFLCIGGGCIGGGAIGKLMEKIHSHIEKIHATPHKCVVAVSGAGTQAVAWLLGVCLLYTSDAADE